MQMATPLSSTLFWVLVLIIIYAANAAVNNLDQHEKECPGRVRLDTGGLSRKSFPKGFVFGTSSAAYQVEGMVDKDGRGPSIWDVFVKIPGKIVDNSTADVTVDQYHLYKDDVNLMQEFNFDAYRFSISWSRIFPNGTGRVNWKGVAYYNRLIDYLLKKGITPHVTLFHFDLPQALEDRYNGFLSRKIVKDYAKYAEFCFKTYGDRIKNWQTFNEPRVTASVGYIDGKFPPSRCSKPFGNCTAGNSSTEPYIVAHNILLSHAAAVKSYREIYQDKQNGRIGISLDFLWYEPLTRSKRDNYAAQRARDFIVGWFLHPIIYGEYPKTMQKIVGERLPKFGLEEVTMVKGSIDFLGINHYTSNYTYDPQQPKPNVTNYLIDWSVAVTDKRRGVPIGAKTFSSSWIYIVPWGMYKSLKYIKERYGNLTIIISENGINDPGNITLPKALYDTTRINYYKDYLTQLKNAIDEGVNVVGYFAWSLLDCFELTSGYTSKFGMVYVDYKDLQRYPKISAYWFKQMLKREYE